MLAIMRSLRLILLSPPIYQGPVVDSNALASALSSGKIFGAGVDVVDGEPNIPADHPLVKEPRCVVLPHIGSASWDSREGMAMLCESCFLESERW